MNTDLMLEWATIAIQHMNENDVLILDRLSCHLTNAVKKLFSDNKIELAFLPPKGSLLLSPLDRGFFGMFEKAYRKEIHSLPKYRKDRKFKSAAVKVHHSITTQQVIRFFKNCGLDPSTPFTKIKKNFEEEMGRYVKNENLAFWLNFLIFGKMEPLK